MEITDDQFFKQLYCVIGELHQIAQTQLAKQATFRGQGRLIFLLANNEGVSQRELATLARVKPGSISEVLERLEKDQLVERWRDQQDRRIVRVKLTAKGQQMHLKNLRARQEFAIVGCHFTMNFLQDLDKGRPFRCRNVSQELPLELLPGPQVL